MERFSAPFEFKRTNLSSAGEFEGYASTFGGQPDSYGDVITAGAFKASLITHKERGTTPAFLWAHDPAEPIGKLTELREDAKGLAIKGRLTLDTARGKDAHALMKDGALALSIGYRVAKGGSRYEKDGTRTLTSVELWEISTVAMPANPAARITSIKSINDIRSFEAELRDVLGFSKRAARTLASAGWPAYAKKQGQPDSTKLIEVIRQSTENLKG